MYTAGFRNQICNDNNGIYGLDLGSAPESVKEVKVMWDFIVVERVYYKFQTLYLNIGFYFY